MSVSWPCCDYTSSDDDEHNTDNNFFLLFAHFDMTPTLLEGLSEVDILRIAIGCRLALEITPRLMTTSTTLTTISSSCSRTDMTPTLLEGLSEVDILRIAIGCRLALDIFTISQQYSPTTVLEPLPLDAELEPLL